MFKRTQVHTFLRLYNPEVDTTLRLQVTRIFIYYPALPFSCLQLVTFPVSFDMLDAVQICLLSLAGDCVLIMHDTRLLHPLAKSSSMARVILIV